MVRDVTSHIRTVAFIVTGVDRRSDGAYTVVGTHQFYDANNNYKSVSVTYTLAASNGRWIIVAAGSTEPTSSGTG